MDERASLLLVLIYECIVHVGQILGKVLMSPTDGACTFTCVCTCVYMWICTCTDVYCGQQRRDNFLFSFVDNFALILSLSHARKHAHLFTGTTSVSLPTDRQALGSPTR